MNLRFFVTIVLLFAVALLQSCSTFKYRTYDQKANENIDDPDPNYELTLDENFQTFTSYMFIGNRIENFGTYFNTYFNAKENFDEAYDDYATRVLATYSINPEAIFTKPALSQEATDKFNKSIEKASKVIQFHKSSEFLDKSILLIGKAYYFLGDYLKAERKFGEFISKLKTSKLLDEALLYLAKTQMRLDNEKPALESLDNLIKTSKSKTVVSESYQSLAEYYLYKKNKESAIKNFKKAIEFSSDDEFKAQMQYLVAAVTYSIDPKSAAMEYNKVLDYDPSFDLEYLARLNYAKSLILKEDFNRSKSTIEDLNVKYKDNNEYLSQIAFLNGMYFEEKKDYKNALTGYYAVIQTFPSSVPSSDASYRIAVYFEKNKGDYLNAFRYYRFSTEQNAAGTNKTEAASKMNIFKRYFELRSIITGTQINTEYDDEFKKKTNSTPQGEDPNKNNKGQDTEGKGGSMPGDNIFSGKALQDSLIEVDSSSIKTEAIAKAKFEIAELFLYDLNEKDSCETYLKEAYDESGDYDFKAKVLFALAAYYKSQEYSEKSDEILRQIVSEYPLASITNSARRLLHLSVDVLKTEDAGDSLYSYSEEKFNSSNYREALSGFKELITVFPGSTHLEKAMYGSGWIYENVLNMPDSAYFYYSSLIKAVPNSEAAANVLQKVSEYENFLNPKIDSTQNTIDTNSTNSNQDPEFLKQQELLNQEKLRMEQNEGNQDTNPDKDLPNKELPNKDPLLKEDEKKVEDPSGDGNQ